VRYHVTFNGPGGEVESFDTRGVVATPTRDLPTGTGSVAVYAVDDQGTSGATATQPLTIGAHAAPTITGPTATVQGPPGNLAGLPQVPTVTYPAPPVLAWAPVAGAKTYDVQVSSTGTTLNYTTASTSVVPTDTLALAVQGIDKVWTWTVRWRSTDNVISNAATAQFRSIWPASVALDSALTPDDTDVPIDLPNTPAISDTAMKWAPAPGAESYQLQIYSSNDFTDSSKQKVDTTLRATRFSPSTELGNASYWWRVRPVYPGGSQFGEWSSVWKFQRKWGKQDGPKLNPAGGPEIGQLGRPTPLTPTNGASVSEDALVLSWTAVPRASRYEIQWRDAGQLSWDGKPTCATFHTSITQQDSCGNLPGTGSTVEWRIRAIDEGTATSNWSSDDLPGDPASPSFSVTARSAALVPLSTFKATALTSWVTPTPDVRELSWSRVENAAALGTEYPSYRIDFALDEAFTNVSYTYGSRGTHLVPTTDLADNNVGQAYYYRVVPCTSANTGSCLSNANAASGFFSKRGTPAAAATFADVANGTPVTDVAPATDQVRIVWAPRSTYALNDGAIRGYRVQVSTQPDFASLVDEATVDQPWYVAPNKLYPNTVNVTDHLYVRVQTLSGSGQGLAWSATSTFRKTSSVISGAATTSVATCSGSSSATYARAPLFCWASAALTDSYQVEVYLGADRTADVSTRYSAWTPTNVLQPGTYSWRVRRTDVSGQPSAWTNGTGFTIGFPAPVALAPTGQSVPRAGLLFTWNSVANAVKYRVEMDQVGDGFSSPIEQVDTANARFAPRQDLPAGTYEWRVTAVDGDGHASGSPSSTSSVATIGLQTVPAEPKNVQLTRGAGSVYISWEAGPTGLSPLTEYRVRYRITGNLGWTIVDNIPSVDGSRTLTGLANSSEYQIQVSARNILGWGPWTGTSTVTTPSIPGTVGSPGLSDLGGGKVKVTWGAPGDGGTILTRYDVQIRPTGGAWPATSTAVTSANPLNPPPTETTLNGLAGGTAYDVRIRAGNGVGDGLYGSTQSITVALPGAVPGLSLSRGDRRAVLTWSTPSVLSGEVLSGYELRIRSRLPTSAVYGAWSTTVTAAVSPRSRTFTGLTPTRVYQIEIRAKGLSGVGPASTSTFTALGVPGAPAWATNSSSGKKIYLRWKTPTANGAKVTRYAVQVYANKRWYNTKVTYSSSAKAFVWTSGRVGVAYTFRVAAVNAVGQGPWGRSASVRMR